MDRRRFVRQGTLTLIGGLMGISGPFRTIAQAASTPPSPQRPRIALIIDDIGFNPARARAFLDIGVPMTFAVLPRLAHSVELAREIYDQGQLVMLHQPMEPFDASLDPGPGALFVRDDPGKITSTVRENLAEIPWAEGVNNHMGSRFTASPEKMSQVLPVIRDEGLFFVDSLTSGRSKAYPTARRLHMPVVRRNVFLDNRREEDRVLHCLNQLHAHARRHGQAVGIGHPHIETARAVARFVASLPQGAVRFVHVSEIL